MNVKNIRLIILHTTISIKQRCYILLRLSFFVKIFWYSLFISISTRWTYFEKAFNLFYLRSIPIQLFKNKESKWLWWFIHISSYFVMERYFQVKSVYYYSNLQLRVHQSQYIVRHKWIYEYIIVMNIQEIWKMKLIEVE